MPHTLCTFNVNNLFVRYRFGTTFPGDVSGKSAVTNPALGYLPMYDPDLFELFNPSSASSLRRRSPAMERTFPTSSVSRKSRASSPCAPSTSATSKAHTTTPCSSTRENDLADEMNLLIVPVVVGQGTRLFPDAGPDMALDLVESRAFPRGITLQVYRPTGRPQYATD